MNATRAMLIFVSMFGLTSAAWSAAPSDTRGLVAKTAQIHLAHHMTATNSLLSTRSSQSHIQGISEAQRRAETESRSSTLTAFGPTVLVLAMSLITLASALRLTRQRF